MREKLYYDITADSRYLDLKAKEQEIIADGLKRSTCLVKAITSNIPYVASDFCNKYKLRRWDSAK